MLCCSDDLCMSVAVLLTLVTGFASHTGATSGGRSQKELQRSSKSYWCGEYKLEGPVAPVHGAAGSILAQVLVSLVMHAHQTQRHIAPDPAETAIHVKLNMLPHQWLGACNWCTHVMHAVPSQASASYAENDSATFPLCK